MVIRKYRWVLVVCIAILVSMMGMISGCSPADEPEKTSENQEKGAAEYPGEDDVIRIVSDKGEETVISVEELMELNPVEEEIIKTDDDGNIEDQYPVKGTLLNDVLESIGTDPGSVDTIRLTAGDGYSVEVPNHILTNRDIILAYEIDGEPLFEGTRPIRVFIPGEEAMYWIKNAVEIKLTGSVSSEAETALNEIIFMETIIAELDEIEYAGDKGEKAVKTSSLFEGKSASGNVYMLAADGFEKNEEYDTFIDAFIVTVGDNSPAFRSPDLPGGMHVKDLVFLSAGNTGFFSVERGTEIFDNVAIEGDTGIGLADLIERFNLEKADKYIIEAADGYSVEIGSDDISKGIVYMRDSGEVASKFDGLPKNTGVKNLLSIYPAE